MTRPAGGSTGALAGAAGGTSVGATSTGSIGVVVDSLFLPAAATPAAVAAAAAATPTPAATALPDTPAFPSSPREASASSTLGLPPVPPGFTDPRQAPV